MTKNNERGQAMNEEKATTKKRIINALECAALLIIIIVGIYRTTFGTIPDVKGMDIDKAMGAIIEAGFKDIDIIYEYSDSHDCGIIYDQNKEGFAFKFRNKITLTESLGPEKDLTVVPNNVSSKIDEAANNMKKAGFKKFRIVPVTDYMTNPGQVTAQDVPAQLEISKDSIMSLFVTTIGNDIEFEVGEKTYTVTGTDPVVIDLQ